MNLGNILKKDSRTVRGTENVKVSDSMTKGERLYKLQNEIRNLKPGQTLQGTVVGRNGNTVQIALTQEFSINAKIDQNIQLTLGQLMSFEIKTNNGSLLSLSPLYTNTANVETILRALSAAGLQETAGNIEMVAAMMEEGMPIDRESILNMSRQLLEFTGQDPTSVIQMTRLGLPITEADIRQFEMYKNLNYQLLDSAETIMDELPKVFAELISEGNPQEAHIFYQNVLDIFTSMGEDNVLVQADIEQQNAGQTVAEMELLLQNKVNEPAGTEQSVIQQEGSDQIQQPASGSEVINGNGVSFTQEDNVAETSVLTNRQWNSLADMLKEMGIESTLTEQIRNGEVSPRELLNLIKDFLGKDKAGGIMPPELEQVLNSREFHTLLKSEIEKQWLIEPKNVADPDKVEKLYERIRQQSAKLMETLQTADKGNTSAARTVQNLQNNVDFMNKMNQVFTYIQLPLKMTGSKAHGDLYVYTNKKSLAAKDGNVSALLHLDMEHLGPLDVYVAMQNQKVSTNFTLSDESALDLIEQHIGLLDERLAKRGYDLKAQFQIRETEDVKDGEGIMQTILKQDKNISVLSRTSFDMRA
ncbi:MAG: flagellar hook-length control protein FliK [Lachnospiraceae bacterium]|nr:flagellar hook-length control protein FliK [Lachnospiraceae bacterium]